MNFSLAVSAVFPILFYMLVGVLLNRRNLITGSTLEEINQVLYKYCFPLVLFNGIYRSNLADAMNPNFLLVILCLLLFNTGVIILILPRFFTSKPVLGSMIQGIVRGNSVLFALPVVSVISGNDQTGLALLSISMIVPLDNLLCVIILEFLRGKGIRIVDLLKSILKNPIIIGAAIGILIKLFGIMVPFVVEKVVADIAGMVTPLALVMLGAGLHFSDTMSYRNELAVVSAAKLLLVPLTYISGIKILGFDKVAVTTAMALGVVPTAVSSFVMAKQMQSNDILAGQIVAVTTVLSIISVFSWVLLLSGIGWIG